MLSFGNPHLESFVDLSPLKIVTPDDIHENALNGKLMEVYKYFSGDFSTQGFSSVKVISI